MSLLVCRSRKFEHALTQVTGLRLEATSLEDARLALAEHKAAAYLVCESGVRIARNTRGVLAADVNLLNSDRQHLP